MLIRFEEESDATAVRAVNELAFGSPVEADIVDALCGQDVSLVSLVAQISDQVVGHILFSPVTLAGHPEARLMGLGPMAVLPAFQRQGVGSALVTEGLRECRRRGCGAVVVLGHPEFYPRFGFVPASRYGIASKYEVPDEVFMAIELEPHALEGLSGLVRYKEAFDS